MPAITPSKQEEINQLLVDFAWKYGHVVRLKGGDPYVFGRGNEELRRAQRHGVPLPGELAEDGAVAAKRDITAVILMGINNHLTAIVNALFPSVVSIGAMD